MRTIYILAILVLLALAVPAAPAQAGGVVTVCDEAHLLAALAGGGTVTFACSGTITLTATIIIAANTTIDGSGQNVTISGNNAVRVLTVNAGVTLNVNELILADGSVVETFSDGAGIDNYGTVNLMNATVSDNSAGTHCSGGAIYNNTGGVLTVSNSIFSGNSAGSGGAAIYNNNGGVLTVNNSIFSGNSAVTSAGSSGGGGIVNWGALTVSDSTFFGNTAGYGGGIVQYWGTLHVSGSTFFENSAYDGGGIAISDSAATVSNSTFFRNAAVSRGGGIFAGGGSGLMLSVTNSTFSSNSAVRGGSIGFEPFVGSNGVVNLRNTIVANSPAGGNCYTTYLIIADGGGNLTYSTVVFWNHKTNPVVDWNSCLENMKSKTDLASLQFCIIS